MNVTRRRLLYASGATVTGLAGCPSLSGNGESPDGGGNGNGNDDGADGDGGRRSDGTEGALELEFGEGAEFTNDNGVRLHVAMSDPRLVEAVPVVRDSEIYVDSPESEPYFLFARVRLANEGSSSVQPPRGLFFRVDGREVERTAIRTPGQKYRDIGELAPGETATGTVAFPAPDGAGTGTVALRFQALLDSPPARWTFDFADVPRESIDLTNDGLGESLTIGTDAYAYEFTPTTARETTAYTYGDGTEHAASAGSKFVLVEARAENVGEEPVNLPNPYDVRLEADGSIARGTEYEDADERYQGQVEPYPPGETQEGVFLFEVPESASDYTLRLAVGNDTFATWPFEAGDG